ncbi:MAG TPA: GNAT family N-acetyltransferase [Syntrophomonadaceae bacterium]|nr:GNAT family N-acetyltransferase [Syntrophomonadaceae bacterium]
MTKATAVEKLPKEHWVQILEAHRSNADAIQAFLKKVSSETDFIASNTNITKAVIERSRRSNNSVILLGINTNGKIISYLRLVGDERPGRKHTATMSLYILQEYWGMGIGRSMIEYALRWAKFASIIRKINIACRSDNKSALSLYMSVGCKIEGEISNQVIKNNRFLSLIQLGYFIE